MARRNASSNFGDFGERSTFGANRSFGAAGGRLSERASGVPGVPAFGMGGIDAARELGGLTPALVNGDLSNPAVQRAVRANATTAAIHQFAEKDALRSLGNRSFGEGQAGERAFASFAPNMVQWTAFGDQRAYDMMLQGATRHFSRNGYGADDAPLKAASVITEGAAEPTSHKLLTQSFHNEAIPQNNQT